MEVFDVTDQIERSSLWFFLDILALGTELEYHRDINSVFDVRSHEIKSRGQRWNSKESNADQEFLHLRG